MPRVGESGTIRRKAIARIINDARKKGNGGATTCVTLKPLPLMMRKWMMRRWVDGGGGSEGGIPR